MVDVVANHMGEGDISSYGPEPLNSDAGYHSKCKVDYDDQNSIENCWVADLPDVNTESDEIQNVFNKWIKWLVNEYDFDGVRIDTVKHVPTAFWDSFSAAAGVYTIGEVFDGDVDYLAGYGSCMDGLLDYAGYYPQNAFYQGTGSAQEMADMIDTIGQKFEDPTLLGTFLDNHDNPRWLNDKSDTTLFKNGLAYVILSRGIPIVYYGSEQGYSGGADPANREDLWRSGFDTKADIYQALTAFNAARKSAGGLAKNDHKHLYIAQNAYAFSREGGDLIVLTTNGGKGSSGDHCFDAPKSGSWNILYGGDGKATADGGQLCLSVKDGEPVVLLAE